MGRIIASDFNLHDGHPLLPVLSRLWDIDGVRGLAINRAEKVLVLLERDHETRRPEITELLRDTPHTIRKVNGAADALRLENLQEW